MQGSCTEVVPRSWVGRAASAEHWKRIRTLKVRKRKAPLWDDLAWAGKARVHCMWPEPHGGKGMKLGGGVKQTGDWLMENHECPDFVIKVMRNHWSVFRGGTDLVRVTFENMCQEAIKLVWELVSSFNWVIILGIGGWNVYLQRILPFSSQLALEFSDVKLMSWVMWVISLCNPVRQREQINQPNLHRLDNFSFLCFSK